MDHDYTEEEIEAAEAASAEAALVSPTEEKESAYYAYACAHGASNTPCPVCFPDQWDVVGLRDDGTPDMQPKAGAVKDDDWQKTYEPSAPPGTTDDVAVN